MEILDAKETDSWKGGASFPLRHRFYRLAWKWTWALAASWTPPAMQSWRRVLLRLFGARLANTAVIYPSAIVWSPDNLVMHEHACIGPKTIIYTMATIEIGAFAIVSQGAHLCAGSHNIEDAHFQLIARPISIGARAWVAAEAFIGPGVTVGEGAVLGARGCAMRDLKPWTVYSGNPSTEIKIRRIRF